MLYEVITRELLKGGQQCRRGRRPCGHFHPSQEQDGASRAGPEMVLPGKTSRPVTHGHPSEPAGGEVHDTDAPGHLRLGDPSPGEQVAREGADGHDGIEQGEGKLGDHPFREPHPPVGRCGGEDLRDPCRKVHPPEQGGPGDESYNFV